MWIQYTHRYMHVHTYNTSKVQFRSLNTSRLDLTQLTAPTTSRTPPTQETESFTPASEGFSPPDTLSRSPHPDRHRKRIGSTGAFTATIHTRIICHGSIYSRQGAVSHQQNCNSSFHEPNYSLEPLSGRDDGDGGGGGGTGVEILIDSESRR